MREVIEKVAAVRKKVGYYPYWVIVRVLQLNDYDIDKTTKEILDKFFVMGDHPEEVVKRRQEELNSRIVRNTNKEKGYGMEL